MLWAGGCLERGIPAWLVAIANRVRQECVPDNCVPGMMQKAGKAPSLWMVLFCWKKIEKKLLTKKLAYANIIAEVS